MTTTRQSWARNSKKKEKKEKPPREFVASKRIKKLHRADKSEVSLKVFARRLLKSESTEEIVLAGKWLASKEIA